MQKKLKKCTLVWFRNDLRLHDNKVLDEAIKKKLPIIGIFLFNNESYLNKAFGYRKVGKFRLKFLAETVLCIQNKLKKYNIPLFIYNNSVKEVFFELNKHFEIVNLFFQKNWTQEELNEEEKVKIHLSKKTIVKPVFNQFLFDVDDVMNLFSELPRSFSSFRKKIEKHCDVPKLLNYKIPLQDKIDVMLGETLEFFQATNYEPKYKKQTAFPFEGGEDEAIKRVNDYFFKTKNLTVYKKTRNQLLGINYSSKFSAWLANGSLSPRFIYWKIKEFENKIIANESTYWLFFELLWREFFKYVSMKHGNLIFKKEGIQNKKVNTKIDNKVIKNWVEGNTSNDFVNSNMLELKRTGWMSNRGRQNTASFFVHDLKQDWRIGAAYFESLLLDYDVHSNYGNWMYIAGVGNNLRNNPFDVKKQAIFYDPEGEYRKKWLKS
ncbi:DASH family cryptochrome [uncultured Tenacibaculum sp.]|uniref:DASH family cryptochrome n=1 Tax=uncultured Tenacibaculum sp. TaxID=174713 RepID=UPI0026086A2C|nr:DASH family cryptochrome [uncultured Tenacibaculum sp.]